MGGTPFQPELFAEAKAYFQKHMQIKSDDPEPYFWIGVIDWTLSFRKNRELRAEYNKHSPENQLAEIDPLPESLRSEYQREAGSAIDEGIKSLKGAISLRPDYDDAMAYLGLLYRLKADVAATEGEREGFNTTADGLLDRVKAIKQQRASQPR
jgi:tetratricopeptide (TPR) repeat protein